MKASFHGTAARYNYRNCRCEACREAHARYQRELRRSGPRTLPAAPVAEYIQLLRSAGLGTRAIADASDINRHAIQWILNGITQRVHVSTAEKIMAVTKNQRANGALVSQARARRRIAELVDGGYTRRWIADRLGYKARAINFLYHRGKIRAITESRVERLYRMIMAGYVAREGRMAA